MFRIDWRKPLLTGLLAGAAGLFVPSSLSHGWQTAAFALIGGTAALIVVILFRD